MAKDYSKFCNFIFVCNGSDCKENGCKALQKSLEKKLRELDLKDTTKVVKTKCTGRCKEGPVVIVKEHWLTRLNPEKPEEILDKM